MIMKIIFYVIFTYAHLIKKKYALVNENQQFAYKERFIKYAKGI